MDCASSTIIDVGVDYITATATHPPKSRQLREIGIQIVNEETEAGNPKRKWRSLGYFGSFSGSASVGFGEQGAIVRISSKLSSDCFHRVYPFCSNVSRLDLQCTVRSVIPNNQTIANCWAQVQTAALERKRPFKAKFIGGLHGSETIMLGSRQSDRYGRIYDKFVESGLDEYQNCVRYEVEFKRAWSSQIAHNLAIVQNPDTFIVAQVDHFLRSKTLQIPTNLEENQTVVSPALKRINSRSLSWLNLSVRPVVQRLIAAGQRDLVLEILGLSENANTDTLR